MAIKALMRRLAGVEESMPGASIPDRLIVAELPDGSRYVADERCPQLRLAPEGMGQDEFERSLPPAWRRFRPEDEASGIPLWVYKVPELGAFAVIPFMRNSPPGTPGGPDTIRPSEMGLMWDHRRHPWARSID